MAILQMTEYTDFLGYVHIQFDELVGTGFNWIAPARVLGMDISSFVMALKKDYDAELTVHRKDDKVSFIGYKWKSLAAARKFKNYTNRIAREKKFTMEVLYANV